MPREHPGAIILPFPPAHETALVCSTARALIRLEDERERLSRWRGTLSGINSRFAQAGVAPERIRAALIEFRDFVADEIAALREDTTARARGLDQRGKPHEIRPPKAGQARGYGNRNRHAPPPDAG